MTRKNNTKRRNSASSGKTQALRSFMQTKLVVLYLLVLLAFAALIVRLFYINGNNGEEYAKQILSQQRYDSRELPFKRGTITDAKGTVLATSELVYNVVIDAHTINNGPLNDKKVSSYYDPTLNAVTKLGLDKAEIKKYVDDHPDSRYYIVKKNLPYADKQAFENEIEEASEKVTKLRKDLTAAKNEKNESKISNLEAQLKEALAKQTEMNNIQGIVFEPAYIRSYPGGSLAAHVIGFANNSNQGSFGLEGYYNDILNGTPGRSYGFLNDTSTLERTVIDATDGDNLQLTLDANIQTIIEKYLNEFGKQYENGEHEGYGARHVGCIIQNVNNGEILGMAAYPGFALQNPYDTSKLVGLPKLDDNDNPTDDILTQADVDALDKGTDEEKSRYLNYLWTNFCISSFYEPGSVAKPFTLAAGLESGKMTGDETYYCGGSLKVDGWTIKCHNRDGDGLLTVDQAIERSCNVALMQMAQQTGMDDFTKFQRIFGFGLRTNIDLADEARTDTLLIQRDKMTNSDLATNSFGQNFDVTMIQMITAFSSLVNGGYYYEPHIVKKITSPSGATVRNIEPRLLKKTVSETTSAKVREATLAVVAGENGTGHTARPAGYMIGGKTGTAETFPRGNGQYVVSFMGYAPQDDPQIAIYVVVDRANNYPQDDAKYATRIVRKVLTEVLPYLNIYMTEPLSDEEADELKELNEENTLAYSADNFTSRPKAIINNLDTNGDGKPDAVDANNDGEPDTPMDSNGDGITDSCDTDGDGVADMFDTDNDGVCDSTQPKEGATNITKIAAVDTNGDGVPDAPARTAENYKTFEKDPETGNYIDPETGKLIDPDTGYVYSDTTMPDMQDTNASDTDTAGGTATGTGTQQDGGTAAGTGMQQDGGTAAGTGTQQDGGTAAGTGTQQENTGGEAAAAGN